MNAVYGPNPRVLKCSPDDFTPLWERLLQIITEIAIQILVIGGVTWAAFALSASPFLLTLIALGTAFTSAFLFSSRQTKQVEVAYERVFPPPLPKAPLARNIARGLQNDSMYCWMNSLFQLVRKDAPMFSEIQRASLPADPNLLKELRAFNGKYDRAIDEEATVSKGDSQALRLAFSASIEIRAEKHLPEDPTVALMAMGDLLPPERKVLTVVTKYLKGLEGPEGVRPVLNPPNDFGYIALELIGIRPRVVEMLERFFNRPAAGDNQMKVNGVEYEIEKEEVRYLERPHSLWLHLKRFTNNAKLSVPVELTPLVDIQMTENRKAQYRLDAFLVHRGMRRENGHYIAYTCVLNELDEEVWYEMNDWRVSIIAGQALDIARENAYLAHYSQRDQP